MKYFCFWSSKQKLTPLDIAIEEQYPSYYIRDVEITSADIEITKTSWGLIMSGVETKPFHIAKMNSNFEYSSLLTWFFDSFYEKFFVLSPEARPMFAHISISAQGRLLAGVISSALGLLRSKDQLHKRLEAMTLKHSMKGVKASQYGTMGAALVWAMELVLGELFTEAVSTAWLRVYSLLLSVIVPVAVRYEFEQTWTVTSRDKSSGSSEYSSAIRAGIEGQLMRFRSRSDKRNSLSMRRNSSKKLVRSGSVEERCSKRSLVDRAWAKPQSRAMSPLNRIATLPKNDMLEEDIE